VGWKTSASVFIVHSTAFFLVATVRAVLATAPRVHPALSLTNITNTACMSSFFRHPVFRESLVISDRPPAMSDPTYRYIAYAATALMLAVVHVVLLPFVAIEGVVPDVLLIWAIWIAVIDGQTVGMVAAFGAGLAFDIVSADVLGSNALAKVVAVFLAGYFHKEGMERQRAGSWLFVALVLACSFVHNVIYFFFYLRPTDINFLTFFLRYGVYTTLYTTVIAVIPKLFISRTRDF
jgi:rod shape-determining protein MreD